MQISFLNGEKNILKDEINLPNDTKIDAKDALKSLEHKKEELKTPKEGEDSLYELELQETGETKTAKNVKLNSFFDKIFGKDDKDKNEDDTKDGKIGPTEQGNTGDCWLLSGINALSYTEKGRELIKDALEYEDGYTIVHLKGYGDVVVKDDELNDSKLSTGDADMRIMELAMKKVFAAIKNGDCVVDPDAPDFLNKDNLDTIEGANPMLAMYLLTGKYGETHGGFTTKYAEIALNTDRIQEILGEFEENNGKDAALSATMNEKTVVKDINGAEITLAGPHAYAVKEVKDGVVTLTNPWNSGEDIKLSEDTFVNTFDGVQFLDLSENNPDKNYISRTFKIDKDGNKVFIFDRSNREDYVDDNMQPVHYSYEEVTFSDVGTILKRTLYNDDGIRNLSRTFDSKTGEQTGFINYSKDGKKALCTDFGEHGKTVYRLADCDESGNPKHWYYIDNEEDIEKLNNRGLMNYSQFNADEIHFLLKLTDKEWQRAEKYLSQNPDADYNDIMKEIYGEQ